MKNIACVIWMLGWPLLRGVSDFVIAIDLLWFIIIWLVMGFALKEYS